MNFKTNRHHMIDILFVFILFGLFTFSSVVLIIIGADIYEKTVQHMEYNYNDRTSISYITEKIRTADENGNIYVENINGESTLVLSETINDIEYVTYLYPYEGKIYELFTRHDLDMDPESGHAIIEINQFNITSLDEHLFEFSLTDTNDKDFTFYVSTHSTAGTLQEDGEE